jgi:chemotaxis protein MotB
MSRKKSAHEEHENHERWLVSYADFITLLFAFFVIMYATSNSDLEKQKKFEGSIKESMGLQKNSSLGGGYSSGLGSSSSHSSSGAGSSVPMRLPEEGLLHQKELEDFIESFFNLKEDSVQKVKNRLRVVSDLEGVSLDLKRQDLLLESNQKDLWVLGSLFKKADTTIVISNYLEYQDESKIQKAMEETLKIKQVLVDQLGLKEHNVKLVFLSHNSRSIDSNLIRFTISR